MAANRKKFSEAQNVALVSQVDGVCPLCDQPLFHSKKGRSYKAYEIAHIYPLNPTPAEIELLRHEERLSDDVNAEQNVIPLCESCHGKFDKPRTVEEYRRLVGIKRRIIERANQEVLWGTHHIEAELSDVVDAIYTEELTASIGDFNYDPSSIDDKTDESISQPTVRKIRNNVSDYYVLIRGKLATIDRSKLEFSSIVSHQIRTFYLKQLQAGISQQAIFDNLVKWIIVKAKPQTSDAAEILASFFIQNCEVFE